jgi:putative DNA primase/helicase
MAVVQNHATMTEPAIWFADKENHVNFDTSAMRMQIAKADADMRMRRLKAAERAKDILGNCVVEKHAYLDSKGFSDKVGLVYYQPDGDNLLAIPMKVGRRLVGVQLINRNGDKKFLHGQQCKNATHQLGAGKVNFYCEGYGTGLSVQAALDACKVDYAIHICFSDSNLATVATSSGKGIVIADHDKSGAGERAALATGLPYYLPEQVGHDFNDQLKELGTFAVAQILKKYLHTVKNIV